MREPTVSSMMTRDVVTVGPEESFKAVAAILARNRISAVPVIGPLGRLIGVVSEADMVAKEEFHGGADARPHGDRDRRIRWFRSLGLTAAEVMTTPVHTIGPDEPLALAARRLGDKGVRRLFVVDEHDKLVGVVSRHDVLGVFLRADEEIRHDIEEQVLLGDLGLPRGTVTVQVADGVAIVDGELDRRAEVELACRLVRSVPGVVGVRSSLTYRVDDFELPNVWTGFRP